MKELLVISSFPKRGTVHDKKVVGVASYSKNTLLSLSKKSVNITVLAERISRKEEYIDGKIKVKRVWKRNSFLTFPSILKEIVLRQKEKNILLEFELAMFGNQVYLLTFPLFLLLLRLLGKNITLVLHQVIDDANKISGHINLKPNTIKATVINFCMKTFYKSSSLFANKIVVFDNDLRKKLLKLTSKNNISVIPHGVEEFKFSKSKKQARKELGLGEDKFVILVFGFIAWYKGTDWIIKAFKEQIAKGNKDMVLLIAGGSNPNHLDKDYYKKYINSVATTHNNQNILVTGFISEDKIPLYFGASDLVVLPYRLFMSASGPLSLAFSFQKPFLVSDNLVAIFKTKDIKNLLNKLNLKEEDLLFENYMQVKERVEKVRDNLMFRRKIQDLSSALSKERSFDQIGTKYYQEIFA